VTQNNTSDKVEVTKIYYKSGALYWEVPRVNGKKHGIEKWYYESGALMVETPYVDGKEHGIKKWYYESGALRIETPYVDGKKHGIHKAYNTDSVNINGLRLYKKGHRTAIINSNI